MSEILAARLDLELAWRRVKHDIAKDRVFIRHPYLIDLIEVNLNEWLEQLREKVAKGEFQPSALRVCDVPKPKGAVRPGGDLELADQVIYCALVADAREQIQTALRWGNPLTDFSYRLRADHHEVPWFEDWFPNQTALANYSIKCIEDGCSHVVVADIAGYYEQVDLTTLRSDLNYLGINKETVSLLLKCLHRWAHVSNRGLPQGLSASDILGKLYLNSVDTTLAGAGFRHCRWVDDYRIFCRSNTEARKALLLLIQTLRRRGLVIQTAKTKILDANEATRQFQEVRLIIDGVNGDFMQKLREVDDLNTLSLTMAQLDNILPELESDAPPVEVLVEAYRKYFIEAQNNFNKSLFRFLLRRLGSARNQCALEHALSVLQEHPEETGAILSYTAALGEIAKADAAIVEHLRDEAAIYPYQAYQMLKWRRSQKARPAEPLLRKIREFSLRDNVVSFLRAEARAALGQWGLPADLEAMMHGYANANGDIEQAEIICAIAQMETGLRNGFLGRVADDSDLCSRAVRLVKTRGVC